MAFTSLVFCELLKSFSFRSETKPLWRVSFFSNLQLPLVVAVSFGLQLLLHSVDAFSRVLKTVMPTWNERWLLLAAGFVPLILLELAKVWRLQRTSATANP
jgi:Ca2+-transporting ATPase